MLKDYIKEIEKENELGGIEGDFDGRNLLINDTRLYLLDRKLKRFEK